MTWRDEEVTCAASVLQLTATAVPLTPSRVSEGLRAEDPPMGQCWTSTGGSWSPCQGSNVWTWGPGVRGDWL
jgi:hypothetical protein